MFKCEDLREGDVLTSVCDSSCCWREGVKYEVQVYDNGRGLYVTASCGADMLVSDPVDWEASNGSKIHDQFTWSRENGPW